MSHKRVLVISDCHFPFAHKDWHNYLSKLKSKYRPTTVIHIGDECDMHSINVNHVIDPDLPSPKDEYELAKKDIQKLYKLFPKMTILESNHGSMVYRRAIAKGMTRSFIKSYNQIWDVGKGWEWKEKHFIAHTRSEIKFVGNDFHLNFGMTVGCLVDVKALSMSYMKLNLKKPILSCGLITDGMPHLTPMYLKRNGSWDGNIYI